MKNRTKIAITMILGLLAVNASFASAKPARYTCKAYCIVASEGANGQWNVSNLNTSRGKSNYSTEESWDFLTRDCLNKKRSSGLPGEAYLLSNLENISFSSGHASAHSKNEEFHFDGSIGFFKIKKNKKTSMSQAERVQGSIQIKVPSANEESDCKVDSSVPQSELPDALKNNYGG